jgi:hypothetical protein
MVVLPAVFGALQEAVATSTGAVSGISSFIGVSSGSASNHSFLNSTIAAAAAGNASYSFVSGGTDGSANGSSSTKDQMATPAAAAAAVSVVEKMDAMAIVRWYGRLAEWSVCLIGCFFLRFVANLVCPFFCFAVLNVGICGNGNVLNGIVLLIRMGIRCIGACHQN